MKKNLLFLVFITGITGLTLPLKAQSSEKQVSLYATSMNFVAKAGLTNALAAVSKAGPGYLKVKKFLGPDGKKMKAASSSWALEYEGNPYFNLGYSNDMNNWLLFIQFDITGKYCAVFIDDDTPDIIKRSGPNYGGSLSGVLMKDSLKWGKAWTDKNEKKRRILFIDTGDIQEAHINRNASGIGNYLTRNQLDKLCNQHGIDLQNRKTKELTFEEVVQLIHRMNAN